DLFDGVGLERRDAQGGDAGGDEVLDDAHLGGGIRLGGALVVGVLSGVLCIEFDSLLHAVEPRDAGELRDGHHRAARVTAATTAAVDGRGRVGPFLGRAAGGQGGGEG